MTPPTTHKSTTGADGTQLSMTTRNMRRVITSSFMGSMVEFYDFVLYATAASIVFNKIFFTDLGPGLAVFASFATLAVGYLARPLGGVIFGHFGDTRGRKKVLIFSMSMMGIASTAMGLLPSTGQVGMFAPAALICLRIVQGVAVGGEWGGAILVALEHAPQKSRGFAASFANAGGPVGAVLATLMLGLFTRLPEDQFLSWGWRVPFLFSVALLFVGLIVRLRITETPMFAKLEQLGARKRVPIVDVLVGHWRAVLLALTATLAFTTSQGLMTVWGVSTAVGHGADKTGVLNWKAVGAVVTVLVSIAAARFSDRWGRRKIVVAGCALGMVLSVPIVGWLQSGTVAGFAVAIILGNGLIQGIVYGPIAAHVAEQFPTRIRCTGASLAYQSSSTLGAGLSPMIASGLVLVTGSTWVVAALWALVLAISAASVLITREGTTVDIHSTAPVVTESGPDRPLATS